MHAFLRVLVGAQGIEPWTSFRLISSTAWPDIRSLISPCTPLMTNCVETIGAAKANYRTGGGSRFAEGGITKCHVRLKFLTWILMVTAQWVSYVRVVNHETQLGEYQWPILKR